MRSAKSWSIGIFLICAMVIVPLCVVLSSLLQPADENWHHIADNLLGDLVFNTVILLAGVVAGTALLGTGMAWFVTMYDFPGRPIFQWAAILPFALPTYVTGYVVLDLFDTGGVVQNLLREAGGSVPGWYPQIRSAGGVIVVMSLSLYPYVYLLARAAFSTHGKRALEAARSLGFTPAHAFFKLILPMSAPWIIGGLLLVSMETLADFGTVAIFNYDTFTTAIYKAWFTMFSLPTATRLASLLLILALVLLALEMWSRRGKRFYQTSDAEPLATRHPLSGPRGWGLTFGFTLILGIAFLVPTAHLIYWTWDTLDQEMNPAYWQLAGRTLLIGLIAAFLLCAGALLLAYGARINHTRWTHALVAFATTGYALPGAVLAVGVFIPLAWFDNRLADGLSWAFGYSGDLILNGTIAAMLAAYFIRFLAVAHQPVQASLNRVRPNMDEAGRSLGHSRLAILGRIHLPLLKPGLISAALLVLIDVMKEMPITLMTRPFGWDTLSIRIFELTSEGDFERAALPSILLVLTGLIPVTLLNRYADQRGHDLS